MLSNDVNSSWSSSYELWFFVISILKIADELIVSGLVVSGIQLGKLLQLDFWKHQINEQIYLVVNW